jgi:aminoglycoside 6'-N-acetyltransferase
LGAPARTREIETTLSALSMAQENYSFRPMSAGDLPLVRRWLAAPHVVQWWGDAEEQFALLRDDLDEPVMRQFLVSAGGRPFGYVQTYDVAAWPEPGFGRQPAGTHGIDQFVGEPDMLGRGHGCAFIRAFILDLLAAGAPRVITDPDPANARAIRAYAKAGFRQHGFIDTRGGPALLMVCNQ